MDEPSAASGPGRPAAVFQSLVAMQRLLLEAIGLTTRQELIFHILNRSVELARYDRAVLWDIRGRRPRLLGVSGTASPDRHSALVGQWRKALAALPDMGKPRLFSPATDAESRMSVLWLPLRTTGDVFAGLWLERWTQPAWTDGDVQLLAPLMSGYGNAFRPFLPRGGIGWFLCNRRAWIGAIAALAIFAVLVFVRLPLRIVAVCEVSPNRPYQVNAPIDGVIEEVLVRPGQEVAEGDELFSYVRDAVVAEYDVAWQQTDMARSDLARARAQALGDRTARAQVRILEGMVRQEEARLEAAEFRVRRLRVKAEQSGVAMVGEPSEWRGRPVATGEAVMLLIDPADSLVRMWLPQDDRIDFDPARPAMIMLNAESGRSRQAELTYVAAHAQPGPEGVYGFLAEARWREGTDDGPHIGLRGTAIVYGEKVSLGYWLFRKPLAAARRFFGI